MKHSDSYVYFLCLFLRSRIIFIFQSTVPIFFWYDYSRFREIILYSTILRIVRQQIQKISSKKDVQIFDLQIQVLKIENTETLL